MVPILEIVLTLVCIASNALMDLSADGKLKQRLNKISTANNKWKDGKKENGERFFLSSTVLVWITDFWHLMQLIFHSSWQLLAIWNMADGWTLVIYFVVLKTLFSAGFELFYRRLDVT